MHYSARSQDRLQFPTARFGKILNCGAHDQLAVEANARQYMPEANKPWEEKLPGLFKITDGCLHTDCLAGRPGLGAV